MGARQTAFPRFWSARMKDAVVSVAATAEVRICIRPIEFRDETCGREISWADLVSRADIAIAGFGSGRADAGDPPTVLGQMNGGRDVE